MATANRANFREGERMNEFWLIERGQLEGQQPTIYWTGKPENSSAAYGDMWTENPFEACRFQTRLEAESTALKDVFHFYRISLHVFG